jgi:hypothetical protein
MRAPEPVCEQGVLIDNPVGSLLAGATDILPGNTGQDRANASNAIQNFAIDSAAAPQVEPGGYGVQLGTSPRRLRSPDR